ncbi:MAG: UrcA family protein, partial [Pseudomonadota bacterium]|nr:UrcA family protein [Pseudomonadota bacterium]
LSSASGQRLLNARLTRAVIDVCGTASDADLAGGNGTRRCLRETREVAARERDQRIAAASTRPVLLAAR